MVTVRSDELKFKKIGWKMCTTLLIHLILLLQNFYDATHRFHREREAQNAEDQTIDECQLQQSSLHFSWKRLDQLTLAIHSTLRQLHEG